MLDIRVVPNASRTGLTGMREGAYVLRVQSPPVDGKANREVIRYLARFLGVGRSEVHIVRGETSRLKTVEIVGSATAEGLKRLRELRAGSQGSDNHGKEEAGDGRR